MFLRTALATILTAALATGAVAKDKGGDRGNSGDAPGQNKDKGTTSASPGKNGNGHGKPDKSTGAPWNYGQVISGLRNGRTDPEDWSDAIDGLGSGATVGVLALSQLRGNGALNGKALDNALAGSNAALTQTRDAIRSNPELLTALTDAGYLADDVVGVYLNDTGGVVLLIDDSV